MGHDSSALLRAQKLLGGGVGLRENLLARTQEPARKVCGRYAGPQVQKKKRFCRFAIVIIELSRVNNGICSRLCKERKEKGRKEGRKEKA